MYRLDFDAKLNVDVINNENTITTGDVIIKAGPGSSVSGINC